MPLRTLGQKARDAFEVPRDLLLGRYPAFVTGGPLPRGHVPVFVFHSLEPESFARKLQHLADNDYVTLSATQYFQFLMGTRPSPQNAVVLTFDDGRGSLWSIGQPLMRRYGMKGIVFLVPGRVPSRPGPLPPTWDDVEARRQSPETIIAREKGDGAFLSWEEIDSLSRAGLFEFQSHTLTHARIHIAPRVAGFLTPGLRHGYEAMDVPLVEVDGRDRLAHELPLGTSSAPSRAPRSPCGSEDADIRRCVETVAGGAVLRPRRLAGAAAAAGRPSAHRRPRGDGRGSTGGTPGWPAPASSRNVRTGPCSTSATPGMPPARPQRLARDTGYRTAFMGKVPGTPHLTGGDPMRIAHRRGHLELLPGRGRADLGQVLRRKWQRRRREGA